MLYDRKTYWAMARQARPRPTALIVEVVSNHLELTHRLLKTLPPPLNPPLAAMHHVQRTYDNVNATDNAAEIAAVSAAVNAASPSNDGHVAGTALDIPEPI